MNTSCEKKNLISSLKNISSADIPISKVYYRDSLSTANMHVTVRIEADYPKEANTLASRNIQEWISEELGGDYSDDAANGKKMLTYYAQKQLKTLGDLKKYYSLADDFNFMGYWDVSIKKIYETKEFVTYLISREEFKGGAHGSHEEDGITFRKMDGRRIDWGFFDKSKRESLRQLIEQSIMKQYFKTDNEEEFKANLLLPNEIAGFPLPESRPVFVKDGVKFTYQQYEITYYAAGLPTCTIPYAAMDSLFSQTGKALVDLP